MPSRHDRIAIIATKHGILHNSKTPEKHGLHNYYRILSWKMGQVGTYNTLASQEGESTLRMPEGELLPAPIPKPDGGNY